MDNYLVHSSKGTSWGKHKYVRIENGRYIYPEDLERERNDRKATQQRIDAQRFIVKGANKLNKYAVAYENKRKDLNEAIYNTKSGIRRDANNTINSAVETKNKATDYVVGKYNQANKAVNDTVDSYNKYKEKKRIEKNVKNVQRAVDVLNGVNNTINTVNSVNKNVKDTKDEAISYTKHTVKDIDKKQKRKVNKGFQYVAKKLLQAGHDYEYGN